MDVGELYNSVNVCCYEALSPQRGISQGSLRSLRSVQGGGWEVNIKENEGRSKAMWGVEEALS